MTRAGLLSVLFLGVTLLRAPAIAGENHPPRKPQPEHATAARAHPQPPVTPATPAPVQGATPAAPHACAVPTAPGLGAVVVGCRLDAHPFRGLAAGVQTKDLKRAHRLAKRLQAGTVWINTWHMIEPNSPFGGYKLSGYGRENGVAMVEHLTKLKQVWVDLNDFTMDLFA